MMQRFYVLFGVFLSLAAATAAQTAPQLLDSFMNRYAAIKGFNGSVLVTRGNEVLLAKGYGYKNVATKAPADGATVYQYGSVTKQFTAALILKLQEEGKLKIDDKLSRYFPHISFADSVTLHHLLTHTSGIYNYTEDARFMNTESTKPTTQARVFSLFQNRPLQFRPGTEFQYSNSNYMLLGYITEKVTGKPYEALLRQYILQPSGMATAGFDFTHLQSSDKAVGYNFINGDKAFPAGIVDSTVSYAAGALYGSVYDLWAWHKAMQEGRLLAAQSRTKMLAPAKENYAYGVMVDTVYGKQRIAHGGGIFGFLSYFVQFPADDVAVVVLTNNASKPVEDISKNLAAITFGKPASWPVQRREVQVPVEVLQHYAGRYELMPGFILTISVDNGQLMAQATGQGRHPLFAESNTRFFYKVVDAQVEFYSDQNGKVTSLTLFQNGAEIKGKKAQE